MALADWDPRLISPERALRLVGDWPVYATAELAELSQFTPEGGGPAAADRLQHNLRCGHCGQSVTLLAEAPQLSTTTAEQMSAVLRHVVMAHDLPLSAAGKETPRGR
jgi:hypothetical protein